MRIRDQILRIGAGILCVVMAALLIVLMFMNHRRNQERADALRQRTQERKVQETQKMEKAAELYEQYVHQLGETRVVCWGDAVMAGKGDVSLPAALDTVMEENLYGSFTASYAKVVDDEEMVQVGASVVNMGVRDEGLREILVRAGVNQMKVGEWVLIPGDTEPQNIVLGDDTLWTPLQFARQEQVTFGKVVIEDTEGTLVEGEGEYDSLHPRFAFVRDEEGDSFQAGAGTEIEVESASKYLGSIPVLFFQDDSADSVDSFLSDVEDLVDRYTDYYQEDDEEASEEEPAPSHGFVVICTTEGDSDLDAALRDEFGDHYIRSDLYADALTADNCKNLAQTVFDALDAQGCFDDVKNTTRQAVEALDDLSVQVEH
ncbi:MAG: hypothetical protein IJ100_06840 [Lachnospiraceae bacterium]|jgi:hypothetical protein|nr:hypothetical protein [Lachnospiraceae bacterium]